MPFRERAKNIFRTKSRGNSLATTSSTDDQERWPSNVYKPGEPMPRPKYRGVPQKDHKEKLEAFSFADAWRKKSFQSNYSPMGTRAPSRRASFLSMGRKSFSGKSGGRKAETPRTGSVTSVDTDKTKQGATLEGQPEADGDDDIYNVGLSRVQSRERALLSKPRIVDDKDRREAMRNALHKTNTAHDHQPFTEQDFQSALNRLTWI